MTPGSSGFTMVFLGIMFILVHIKPKRILKTLKTNIFIMVLRGYSDNAGQFRI